MKQETIGFDIDGVLADWISAFLNTYINPEFGTNYTEADFVDYYPHNWVPGCTKEDYQRLFKKSVNEGIYNDLKPYKGIEAVAEFSNTTPLVFITHRPKIATLTTRSFLRKHKLRGNLYLVDSTTDKPQILALENSKAFVEDNLETALAVRDVVPVSVLINKPYNQNRPLDSGLVIQPDLSNCIDYLRRL